MRRTNIFGTPTATLVRLLRVPPGRPTPPHHHARKVRVVALVVFLLLCSPVAGQLIVLPTTGKSVGAVTAPEAGKWLVFGPNSLKSVQPTVLDGGKCCLFEGLSGEYAVVFLPPGDTAQPLVANLVLGGTAPLPPDPVDPVDPLSIFARQVRDWCLALVPAASRGKAAALAQSFSTVSSQMAAGTLATPEAVIKATYEANLAVLGNDREQWALFREKLRVELNARSKAGTLQTIPQHMAVWDEIAAGLRAVK